MTAHFAPDSRMQSWGRVVRAAHLVTRPLFRDEIDASLALAREDGRAVTPFGAGRSYGDSALNPQGALIDMRGLDRFIAFDAKTHLVRVEAGLTLSALIRFAIKRGLFPATVPGTRHITIGGAIAHDVHGKNHHTAGTFGTHVPRLSLVRTDRGALDVSSTHEAELYAATIGGMGLTGLITDADVALVPVPSAFIDCEYLPFSNLSGFFALAEDSASRFEHTVAWVDCTKTGDALGRGIFQRANWSHEGGYTPHSDAYRFSLPFDAPELALNAWTLKLFNEAYYAWNKRKADRQRVPYSSYFFPLDAIGQWNRLYGAKGFYQYQCVIPLPGSEPVLRAMLEVVARSGEGSFLAVLKTFGDRPSPGLLSFPQPGVTLALDFRNRGAATLALLSELDDVVASAGGRLYAAKDGRMPASLFKSGYPDWPRFDALRDPGFSSSFWRRVMA